MRHLARVQPASVQGRTASVELTHFCTHCAAVYDAASSRIRVCPQCSLGVILTCSSATLDAPGGAFLVVPADLKVSAASQPAEDLLGVPDGAYGRPLASLLTSPVGMDEMNRLVIRAASGTYAPSTIPVALAASRREAPGLEARVGGCGNPPAALVVMQVTSS